MPHVELDTGINAFYRREGEGPPLVLIMGTGLDHRCWDGQVKEYRKSYDCVRFDNRGCTYCATGAPVYRLALRFPQLVLQTLCKRQCPFERRARL